MTSMEFKTTRLKYLISGKLKYGLNEPAIDENHEHPRYIRITDFGNDGKLTDETFKSMLPELARGYYLTEGDILFARSGATVGKTFQYNGPDNRACFAGYLIKASPDKRKINPKYLMYFTASSIYENWKSSIFSKSTIQNIGADKYSSLPVSHPLKLMDQEKIVFFLDKKCEQIEKAIAKKQELIKKLEEEFSTVLSRTITEGDTPSTKNQATNNSWIKIIPTSWVQKRLKFIAKINPEKLQESVPDNYMLRYVDIGNVGTGYLKESPITISFKDAPSRARRKVKNGDTIISTVRTYLKAVMQITDTETENLIVSTGFAVVRADRSKIDPEFLYYYLRSDFIIQWITSISKGVSYPAINATDLASAPVFFPKELNEQRRLVGLIKSELGRISGIKDKINKEISLLIEYRTTLISDAVAGKLDTRIYQQE